MENKNFTDVSLDKKAEQLAHDIAEKGDGLPDCYLFGVKDTVAGQIVTTFTATNVPLAVRQFNKMSEQSPYATDYQLYRLAGINMTTAEVVPSTAFICSYQAKE